MKQIFDELEQIWATVDIGACNNAIRVIGKHEGRIVCLGAGRMGYAVQGAAMRLAHLGYDSFMLGDTSVPRLERGDIVIANSSSGSTPSICLMAQIAKAAGAVLIVVTGKRDSKLAEIADHLILYELIDSGQLMKTLYEQFSMLLFDYMLAQVFELREKDREWVERNHSILE